MTRYLKIVIILLVTGLIYSCASDGPSASERSRSAQDRINASQSGADSVFKDIE